MKKRIYICPSSKEEFILPANLYPNNHKIEGKWIYNLPEGKKSLHGCIDSETEDKISPAVAIEIAHSLNKEHYGIDTRQSSVENRKGYMGETIENFIEWMNDNDKNQKLTQIENGKTVEKENWKNLQAHLRKLAVEFSKYTFNDLPFEKLAQWYQGHDNFTGNTQAKARTIFLKFFTHNIHSDPRFMLLFSAGGLKIEIADKKRGRLSGSQFNHIRELAITNNEWALVNAMDIGLLTMLRRTNICKMEFSHIGSDKLNVGLIKKKLPVTFVFDLNDESNKSLHDVIKRCRVQSRDMVIDDTPVPNFIHTAWFRGGSQVSGKKGNKNHLSSVTPAKLTNLFKEYRDMIPEIAALPMNERPTFHEIRALGCHRAIKAGLPLEEVSMLLGHKDVETTERFYKRGHEAEIYDVVCAVSDVAA